MLYLLLSSLLLLACVFSMHKNTFGAVSNPPYRPNPFRVLVPFLVASAYCAPVLALFTGVFFRGDEGETASGSDSSIYLMLASSMVCLAYGAACMFKSLRTGQIGFWPAGLMVSVLLAGVVGSLSAYSHLSFYSNKNAGLANLELLREVTTLKDMGGCKSGMALVHFNDVGPLLYRCPTSVIFSPSSKEPFLPWPDYVEGTSSDLAAAVSYVRDMAATGESVEIKK